MVSISPNVTVGEARQEQVLAILEAAGCPLRCDEIGRKLGYEWPQAIEIARPSLNILVAKGHVLKVTRTFKGRGAKRVCFYEFKP